MIVTDSNTLHEDFKQQLCGWIPSDERTQLQDDINKQIVAEMPRFAIVGSGPTNDKKVVLWDNAIKIFGNHLACFYQEIGSCVGQGKAKAEWYVQVRNVMNGDQERIIMPYEPYGYSMSRVCAGISGNSDGSTGSGAAKAAVKYGILRSNFPNLVQPKPAYTNTLIWPGAVDKEYGNHSAPQTLINEGTHHLVSTTAQMHTPDDVRQSLINLFPCTCASNWGGLMKPPIIGSGDNKVLLNRHADTWNHQMMICGFWAHPEFDNLYYIQNSWSEIAHGEPPDGAPPGGFWIQESDLVYILSQSEVFSYAGMRGFEASQFVF